MGIESEYPNWETKLDFGEKDRQALIQSSSKKIQRKDFIAKFHSTFSHVSGKFDWSSSQGNTQNTFGSCQNFPLSRDWL